MFALFSSIQDRVRVKVGHVSADNLVFKLHYKLTVVVLLVCTALVCGKQYIGEPILCTHDKDGDDYVISEQVINNYCFIMSTYTVPKHYDKIVGKEIPHRGIGPHTDKDEIKYHAYYQWVPFVLFLQAILFYVPHYTWKLWDGGKVKVCLAGLRTAYLETPDRHEQLRALCKIFAERLNTHKFWAYQFVFCEILNLVNVVGNIYFTDFFLGGEFSQYGLDVVNFLEQDPEDRSDPMARVFPKVTKCTFHKYGPSGTIQKHDALCVMALNIVNEKIYTFLWFWFIILACITALGLVWRGVSLCLRFRTEWFRRSLTAVTLDPEYMDIVAKKCDFGDWLFLHVLGRNMEALLFKEFISELAKHLMVEEEDQSDPEMVPMWKNKKT